MWFGYWINCALSSSLSHVYYWKGILHSAVENIDNNLIDLCEPVLTRTLLFDSNSFDTYANTNVLNATIEYILSTKRFDELLFQSKQNIFKQVYESVYSVFIAVVIWLICNFFVFLGFVLFLGTLTILGTWWLSLLILLCMI